MLKEELSREELAAAELAKEELTREEIAGAELAKEELAREELAAAEELARGELVAAELAKEELAPRFFAGADDCGALCFPVSSSSDSYGSDSFKTFGRFFHCLVCTTTGLINPL